MSLTLQLAEIDPIQNSTLVHNADWFKPERIDFGTVFSELKFAYKDLKGRICA